ncbi:MAG: ATP-binding cassette domain-containing protein [Clostridia bacterium]|nr:ATP-binding cassette domain-containing protein [Clostridia bacterium]
MLEFQNVCFAYGKKQVLTDLSFTLSDGEILAVMGESGCGKSTLLQLVAGFLKPKSGIILNQACKISYAFQEPRLFPWLTVTENLRAVLSDKDTADSRIADALDTVSLSDAAHLYPDELSGGMKSRASLARALAYGGDLYLLDEPFAALNEELRAELSIKLRERIRQSGASAILVTHQRADAELMADRILML